MLFLSALIPLFLSTLVTASPTASSVGQLQCNDQHSNSGFLSLNGQYIEPDPTMRATSKDPYVFYSDGDGYGSGDGGGNTYNYACNSTYYKASTKDGLYRKLVIVYEFEDLHKPTNTSECVTGVFTDSSKKTAVLKKVKCALKDDSSQIGQFWIESDGILKLVGPSNLPVTKGKKGPGYNFYKENNQLVARYEKNFVASLTVK